MYICKKKFTVKKNYKLINYVRIRTFRDLNSQLFSLITLFSIKKNSYLNSKKKKETKKVYNKIIKIISNKIPNIPSQNIKSTLKSHLTLHKSQIDVMFANYVGINWGNVISLLRATKTRFLLFHDSWPISLMTLELHDEGTWCTYIKDQWTK